MTNAKIVDNGTVVEQEVSELKNGKREAMGTYPCFIPTLAAFGLTSATFKADAEGNPELDENGLVQYDGLAEQFLYSAVVSAAKTVSRNKLMPKTATLRAGSKFPETLEELITPTVRSGSAVLAERHALNALWAEFMEAQGKAPAVTKLAISFMKQPEALMTQPEKVTAAMQNWLGAFLEQHGSTLTDWQANHLTSVVEACEADASAMEW